MPKARQGRRQHQQELMMGFVWADNPEPALRSWILDHVAEATSHNRAGPPLTGPGSHGGSVPCTRWVLKKHLLNENTEGKEQRHTKLLPLSLTH